MQSILMTQIKINDVLCDASGKPFAKVSKVNNVTGNSVETLTFMNEQTRYDFDSYIHPFLQARTSASLGWNIIPAGHVPNADCWCEPTFKADGPYGVTMEHNIAWCER
jgi:hypothetical protein